MRALATAPEAIDALEDSYRFRQPNEVRAFLAANPDLLDLLDEAAAKIREFMPIDEPIVLEMLWDPEDEDDLGELFAIVTTNLAPQAVRPLLARLGHEWLNAAGRFAAGRFNVDVEYR